VAYYGNYDQSEKAHDAIGDKMKADGLVLRDAVIEEYVTDPTAEPDTAKWLTNIYYPIK
jgi:effector-binding domain-containing protein